jgi:hypothetical protein
MNGIEQLKRNFLMHEAVLDRLIMDPYHDVIIAFEVDARNITKHFAADHGFPIPIQTESDRNVAKALMNKLFPSGRLEIAFRNVAHFEFDRWRAYRDGERLLSTIGSDYPGDSWDGAREVFGFSFLESSPLLEELGRYKPNFHHLSISITDAQIDVVFEQLDLLNYQPPR